MIDHAFEFDQDGDGKLSREEMTAFAETLGQRRGPGGPHGAGEPSSPKESNGRPPMER